MTSFREPETPAIPNPLANLKLTLPLPTQLAISATTGPLIGLLVSANRIGDALTQLGVSSEELFRGDRLPTLPLLQMPVKSIRTSLEKDGKEAKSEA